MRPLVDAGETGTRTRWPREPPAVGAGLAAPAPQASVFPWPARASAAAATLTDAVVSDTHSTTAAKVGRAALKRGMIEPLFPKCNLPSSHGTNLF